MAFTPDERVRIRHHLGFPQVGEHNAFVAGVPAPTQLVFQVEGAMDRIIPQAEKLVRKLLDILDGIEGQGVDDLELLAAAGIGDITLRPDEQQQLDMRYWRYAAALANALGTQHNPFDARRQGGGINLKVMG